MKLTGLQIFKKLPGGKKEKEANCKKCGFPTCMAYAMKLAKGDASLEDCNFISDELKALLEEAGQLQQIEIVFGPESREVKVGNEIVMFRHDKKFVNETALSVKLCSSDINFQEKLEKICNYSVERVGENLKISAVALVDTDETFVDKAILADKKGIALILVSENIEKIKSVLELIHSSRPMVFVKNTCSEEIAAIEQEFKTPVILSSDSVEKLAEISQALLDEKAEKLVLNLSGIDKSSAIEDLTYIRRAAIEQKYKPLGFPVIEFLSDINDMPDNVIEQSLWASSLMCKYANVVVLDDFNEALIYSLLTLRQNIFTDPEKPLQIDSKLYSIGDVDCNSPVIVTTNFALTYFSVATEIEASGVPVHLVITPSDGMSVLTAWSAGKFTAETIAKAFKEFNIADVVSHRKLIIPGLVGYMKEEVEEELPDWEVIVGTNEAVEIVDFLRDYTKTYTVKA